MNHELTDVQAGFRKGRGARDQIASIHWFKKSKIIPEKQSTSASLTMLNPFTVWITTNWKIHKAMGIPDHFTCLLRNLYAGQEATVRMRHGTIHWTDSKLGKEYIKGVYCHPAYLTYLKSTSCETPGWMKHKQESRLPGEISIASDM